MANNGMTPSENARIVAAMVRPEDLEELEALHSDLLKRVDQAREDGRLFMMGQYVRLVALVGPEIKRIHARFQRETLAMHRSTYKDLKLKAKEAAEAAKA